MLDSSKINEFVANYFAGKKIENSKKKQRKNISLGKICFHLFVKRQIEKENHKNAQYLNENSIRKNSSQTINTYSFTAKKSIEMSAIKSETFCIR